LAITIVAITNQPFVVAEEGIPIATTGASSPEVPVGVESISPLADALAI
jgi:hypothetical protein